LSCALVCLATTLLKDDECAQDNHIIIWLLTITSHLKYVATLPCNLSLITCFLTLTFHMVAWQHMQGVSGVLITTLLQIYEGIFQRKHL